MVQVKDSPPLSEAAMETVLPTEVLSRSKDRVTPADTQRVNGLIEDALGETAAASTPSVVGYTCVAGAGLILAAESLTAENSTLLLPGEDSISLRELQRRERNRYIWQEITRIHKEQQQAALVGRYRWVPVDWFSNPTS